MYFFALQRINILIIPFIGFTSHKNNTYKNQKKRWFLNIPIATYHLAFGFFPDTYVTNKKS